MMLFRARRLRPATTTAIAWLVLIAACSGPHDASKAAATAAPTPAAKVPQSATTPANDLALGATSTEVAAAFGCIIDRPVVNSLFGLVGLVPSHEALCRFADHMVYISTWPSEAALVGAQRYLAGLFGGASPTHVYTATGDGWLAQPQIGPTEDIAIQLQLAQHIASQTGGHVVKY
ncbi:hypothetical protein ACSMXN_01305 [Jatrophihabitans sp. DSM 45814]